jgi:hypothetical protein
MNRNFHRYPIAAACFVTALLTTTGASAELRSTDELERNPSAVTGRAGSATLQSRALRLGAKREQARRRISGPHAA